MLAALHYRCCREIFVRNGIDGIAANNQSINILKFKGDPGLAFLCAASPEVNYYLMVLDMIVMMVFTLATTS